MAPDDLARGDDLPDGDLPEDDLPGTVTWAQLLAEAERRLHRGGVVDAAVSARRIVEEASGHEGAAYVLALGERATLRAVASFDRMVARRLPI